MHDGAEYVRAAERHVEGRDLMHAYELHKTLCAEHSGMPAAADPLPSAPLTRHR